MPRRSARAPVRVQSLFGWGRTKEMDEGKEEMWRQQQEILKERRSGSTRAVDETNQRRAEVQKKFNEKKAKKQRQRSALARGEAMPEDEDFKKPYNEEEEGGIIIPIAPFGIPKFDNGERFDLKLPYVDEGWVDESGADPFQWAKDLFSGKGTDRTPRKEPEDASDKKKKK